MEAIRMNCKYCDHELPIGSNPRREFCNDAHKQKYYRQQHQADQNAALLAELEQMRIQIRDQAQEIEEQASLISKLRERLDYERRYLEDTARYPFKTWLKKQWPVSPLAEKLLADPHIQLIHGARTRAYYEAQARRICTEDELREFQQLWKRMLLEQA